MKNLLRLQYYLIVALLGSLPGVALAAEDAPDSEVQPGAETVESELEQLETSTRGSTLTGQAQRGEALQDFESVLWFDVNGQRRWLVERAAIGAVRGGVLLIAAAGDSANGSGHLPTLRHYLPDFGWATYYTNITSDEPVAALISAARAQMSAGKNLLLICEAVSCIDLQNSGVSDFSGVVFVNVPYAQDTRLTEQARTSWQQLTSPSLILQEHPAGWPRDLALAVGFELHLLPMGAADQKNSRVMRKLRGWLKRQLGLS